MAMNRWQLKQLAEGIQEQLKKSNDEMENMLQDPNTKMSSRKEKAEIRD